MQGREFGGGFREPELGGGEVDGLDVVPQDEARGQDGDVEPVFERFDDLHQPQVPQDPLDANVHGNGVCP